MAWLVCCVAQRKKACDEKTLAVHNPGVNLGKEILNTEETSALVSQTVYLDLKLILFCEDS